MNYLLDSHVLLWLMAESYKVGPKTKKILSEEFETPSISLASLWELELKYNKGKLPLSIKQVVEGADGLGINIIGIELSHILLSSKTGVKHTDPFDLMLCAQAIAEDMTLVTADQILLKNFPNSIDARL